MSKFAKGINLKNVKAITLKEIHFYKFLPVNLLITIYQLSRFRAPSCKGF